jgi:hypothetical protein
MNDLGDSSQNRADYDPAVKAKAHHIAYEN